MLASPSGLQHTHSPHDSYSNRVANNIPFSTVSAGEHRQEATAAVHTAGLESINGVEEALLIAQELNLPTSATIIDLVQTPSPEMPSTVPTTAAAPRHPPRHITPLTVDQQREKINSAERQSALNISQQFQATTRRTSGNQMYQNSPRGLPSPTIPQKRQRNSVPVMPSLKPRATLVNAYLSTLLRQGRPPSSFETTRINLLRDACEKDDAFYVAVHHLFCAWDVDNSIITSLNQVHHSINVPLPEILRMGFDQLSSLLRLNTDLAKHVLNWFAVFPTPLSDLVRTSESYRRTVQGALHFISRLSDEWLQLSTDCRERNYPPLVEEFHNRLGVSSRTLQKILFTASRRNLAVEDKDTEVVEKLDRLFKKDYNDYDALVARVNTDRPPMPKELQERRGRLAAEYSYILIEFYNKRDATLLQNTNVSTTAQNRIPTPVSDMHLYQAVASQPAVPTGFAVPEELDTTAQSMSLNSPNPSNSVYSRPPSRVQGQRAAPHLPTPPQPLRSPVTSQEQSGSRIVQGYHTNGQSVPLSAVASAHNFSYTIQQGPLRQLETHIQNFEAQLGRLHDEYQGPRLPPRVAHQEQYLLRELQTMHQHRTHLLGQPSPQQTGHYPHPGALAQVQSLYGPVHGQPNNSGGPVVTNRPQPVPANMPLGNSNITPINDSTRRVSATTPTLLNNTFQSPIPQRYGLPPQNHQSRSHNFTSRVNPQQPNPQQPNAPQPSTQQAQLQQQFQQQQPRYPTNGAPQGPIIVEYEEVYKHWPTGERPLIPPIGVFHRGAPPNPDVTALHQVHLRSPTLVSRTIIESETEVRFYQVVKSLAAGPIKLTPKTPVREVTFSITRGNLDLIAKRLTVQRNGQIPDRSYQTGTLQYRMRCVAMRKVATECIDTEFVVADSAWPKYTTFSIKGHPLARPEQIELRRKASHGKDIPVDLTGYIQDCQPDVDITVTISILGRPKCFSEFSYFFAVEVVEIFDHTQLMQSCQSQRRDADITLQRLRQSLGGNDDDEIALVSDKITLDLTDPFSSQLFTIPVKGKTCLHRECFDLETFLLSRISKPAAYPTSTFHIGEDGEGKVKQPSMIDVWRCPVCNRDARPQNLIVDEFLEGIRRGLVEMGLDSRVKTVMIDKEGRWQPRIEDGEKGSSAVNGSRETGEEDDSGSDGDGMYNRRRKERRVTLNGRSGSGVHSTSGGGERMVIDLSD